MTFRVVNPFLEFPAVGGGAPAIVQSVANSGAAVSSLDLVFTSSITAGSAIVVAVIKSSNILRTITVSDDNGGAAYTSAIANDANSGRQAEVCYFANAASGATTVTVTISAAANIGVVAYEISGVTSTPTIATSEFDTLSGNPKYAAAVTGFSPPANSVVLAAFAFNASCVSITQDVSYTVEYSSHTANGIGLVQSLTTASELTDERPECSIGTITRVGPAVSIAIS